MARASTAFLLAAFVAGTGLAAQRSSPPVIGGVSPASPTSSTSVHFRLNQHNPAWFCLAPGHAFIQRRHAHASKPRHVSGRLAAPGRRWGHNQRRRVIKDLGSDSSSINDWMEGAYAPTISTRVNRTSDSNVARNIWERPEQSEQKARP